jgi:NTE family protein
VHVVFLAWKRKREAEIEAEPVDRQEPKAARPTIGLALGAGAARGWAHIGVVRRLVAAGIEPDVIAGTSIGALVGGTYAAGQLDGLESWAREITKRRVFGLLDFRLGGTGLIGGGRLAQLLRDNVGDAAIENLPIRYAAIATELGTGHEIWLTRGSLVDAIRASYALPAIFPPVKVAGRWLMDGAIVNPIPVSAARALGARVVIAVNLNADVFGRGTVIQGHGVEPEIAAEAMTEPETVPEQSRFGKVLRLVRRRPADYDGPRGISSVMVDAFNITQDRIARSRLAGDPPDVMVAPRLGKFSLFQFHQAEDVIRLGEEAVERALPEINEAIAALG